MGSKSICHKCRHCWSYGGKLYCMISHSNACQYSKNKKECNSFEDGNNYKRLRAKDGSNRIGKCW